MKQFLTGNEIIVRAALTAKAEIFFGYPITPTTEIMTYWTRVSEKDKTDQIKFLQTEDEMAAGFALIGAVLAGKRVFTATSGPGNILMQDAFAMAEAMRLPVVAFIMQRGGPSTGTVIYSQQEVILTCLGGNGEGFRIVYSPSNLQELYDLSVKAFNTAWQYRFPTFVLGDGYQAKMQGLVELVGSKKRGAKLVKSEPYLLGKKQNLQKFMPKGSFSSNRSGKKEYFCLRNCYNLEEELNEANESIRKAYEQAAKKVIEYEISNVQKAEVIIFAHGMVAAAAKSAVGGKVGLFRPITLRPFPQAEARKLAQRAKKIIILESAINQFGRLVKDALAGLSVQIEEHYK
ncbi:MAG TPA: ferredoxin oxidoreductase, partial [Candidatus Portnoybacteria bacterium]|nr:ferredoxin oxidoreductase [Candidatus Portnoybacteria bacterium]